MPSEWNTEKRQHAEEMLRIARKTEEHSAYRVHLARWQVRLAILTLTIVAVHLVYTLLGH